MDPLVGLTMVAKDEGEEPIRTSVPEAAEIRLMIQKTCQTKGEYGKAALRRFKQIVRPTTNNTQDTVLGHARAHSEHKRINCMRRPLCMWS